MLKDLTDVQKIDLNSCTTKEEFFAKGKELGCTDDELEEASLGCNPGSKCEILEGICLDCHCTEIEKQIKSSWPNSVYHYECHQCHSSARVFLHESERLKCKMCHSHVYVSPDTSSYNWYCPSCGIILGYEDLETN